MFIATLALAAWLAITYPQPIELYFPGYAPIPAPSAADKLTPLPNQGVESTFKTYPNIIKTA